MFIGTSAHLFWIISMISSLNSAPFPNMDTGDAIQDNNVIPEDLLNSLSPDKRFNHVSSMGAFSTAWGKHSESPALYPDKDAHRGPAPRYMLELYDKFDKERYAHPVSNIVRSFKSVDTRSEEKDGSHMHSLTFNLSSVSRDEEIYLSELRLHTRGNPGLHPTTITVTQVIRYTWADGSTEEELHRLASADILGHFSRWEAIPVTEAVRKWTKTKEPELQVLDVKVSSSVPWQKQMADIDIQQNTDDEPLLVVFSNDKNKKKSAERDLKEMLQHEMDLGIDIEDDLDADDYIYGDYEDYEQYGDSNNTLSSSSAASSSSDAVSVYKRSTKNTKQRKNRRRRNSCRRKPMYVRFKDINWHNWIIAPEGYQAFECTGRCYYPLSDHLTPTNHAIIQTLLHTTHKSKASRACCVPTRLDPISILYIDEKGIVTYKYKYEDMVVAECGCR